MLKAEKVAIYLLINGISNEIKKIWNILKGDNVKKTKKNLEEMSEKLTSDCETLIKKTIPLKYLKERKASANYIKEIHKKQLQKQQYYDATYHMIINNIHNLLDVKKCFEQLTKEFTKEFTKASKLFLMKSEDNNNIVLVYKNNIKIFTTKANNIDNYLWYRRLDHFNIRSIKKTKDISTYKGIYKRYNTHEIKKFRYFQRSPKMYIRIDNGKEFRNIHFERFCDNDVVFLIVNREKLTVPSQVLMSSLVVDIPKETPPWFHRNTTTQKRAWQLIMANAYSLEYGGDNFMFNDEIRDVELFLDRSIKVLPNGADGHGILYCGLLTRNLYRQRDGPQSQGFKSKRTLEEVKIVMPTLSHEWGKVYVYLSEFNLLSKDPAALRRYKKAIVNAFYDLPIEKQTTKMNTLEKHEYHREKLSCKKKVLTISNGTYMKPAYGSPTFENVVVEDYVNESIYMIHITVRRRNQAGYELQEISRIINKKDKPPLLQLTDGLSSQRSEEAIKFLSEMISRYKP
ncbi:hypothetical protein H8356DRAFT_1350827 [Neocallimastix lanati (nom. inval.)]|nr:hypothetical protein H8356DRAFT_1350827 [Neocallimastix sp. JGI-2020a]